MYCIYLNLPPIYLHLILKSLVLKIDFWTWFLNLIFEFEFLSISNWILYVYITNSLQAWTKTITISLVLEREAINQMQEHFFVRKCKPNSVNRTGSVRMKSFHSSLLPFKHLMCDDIRSMWGDTKTLWPMFWRIWKKCAPE